MLHGVGHRGVGRLGQVAVRLHLAQHVVELFRAGIRKRQCAGARLHAAPQPRKSGAVAIHAVVQGLQHIPQGCAAVHQLGKALAGLALQNFADRRPGVAQLVQHRLGVGRCLRRGNAVGRHDCQPAGQVLQTDIVGRRQRDDLAHAAGQLVHAGFAKILRSQQHVGHVPGLVSAQAVGVQRRGQDIHRRCARRKARRCQHGRLPRKCYRVPGGLARTDGLVGCLGNVGGPHAHRVGYLHDLALQRIQRYRRRVGDRAYLGKRRLKLGAAGKGAFQHRTDARRCQKAFERAYQACAQACTAAFACGGRLAAQRLGQAAADAVRRRYDLHIRTRQRLLRHFTTPPSLFAFPLGGRCRRSGG